MTKPHYSGKKIHRPSISSDVDQGKKVTKDQKIRKQVINGTHFIITSTDNAVEAKPEKTQLLD